MKNTFPFDLIAKCVNDDVPLGKYPKDWIKEGEHYRIKGIAHPLNGSEELCYYVQDQHGKNLEPFDGVPTFFSSRFSIVMQVWLN